MIDERNKSPNTPAPTASAVGPCPTHIQLVRRPGTGSFPSTIALPNHGQRRMTNEGTGARRGWRGNERPSPSSSTVGTCLSVVNLGRTPRRRYFHGVPMNYFREGINALSFLENVYYRSFTSVFALCSACSKSA